MKNRILAFIMLAVIFASAFTLLSCKEKTTYEIVSEAITKTLSLESVDMDFDEYAKTTTEIDGKGVALTVESNHDMIVNGFNTDNAKFNVSSVSTLSGQAMRSKTYYDGEFYYVDSNDTKVKVEKDSEDALLLNSVKNAKTLIKQIPEELLTEIVLEEDEANGTKILELEIEDAKFKEIFKEYIDLQKDTLDSQYDGKYGDVVLKNVTNGKISLLINEEGYIESYTVSSKMIFTMEYYTGGNRYNIRIAVDNESSFKFNDIGKKVTITPPDDLDKYKLQDE